jgi:VanZ family protein
MTRSDLQVDGGWPVTHKLELRLAPLAAALILFSTAVPVELRTPDWTLERFALWDFLANVLLYVPLGWVLRRRPLYVALLSGFVLSTSVEFLQGWFFERHVSAFDMLANTCGCLLGALLARHPRARRLIGFSVLPISRSVIVAAALITIMLIILTAFPVKQSDLSIWDSEFVMLLGNEQTGDRPWRGEVSALALVPSALSRSDARNLGTLSSPQAIASLVERDGHVLTRHITLDGSEGVKIPQEMSRGFAEEAMSRGAFSIVAMIATADLQQEGPARVVSFSRDPFVRNFDLGQDQSRMVFRIRTPSIGENGNIPRAESADTLEAGRAVSVVATYDGAVARLYLDGELHDRNNLAALGCMVSAVCDAALPLSRGTLGGSVALLALGLLKPPRRERIVTVALSAGAITALLLEVLTHWMRAAPVISPWFGVLLVLAGSMVMGLAVRDRASLQCAR